MAQMVLIDTGTLNILINDLGDVVAAHEDDVELTGMGYEPFRVVSITNVTVSQLLDIYSSLIPEIRMAYKPLAPPGKWTFTVIEPPYLDEMKMVYKVEDKFEDLIKPHRLGLLVVCQFGKS